MSAKIPRGALPKACRGRGRRPLPSRETQCSGNRKRILCPGLRGSGIGGAGPKTLPHRPTPPQGDVAAMLPSICAPHAPLARSI